MANPTCLSPLKFYDSLDKQERYKSYAYGHISPVIMPHSKILPFQFVLNNSSEQITSIYIYYASTNTLAIQTNILQALVEAGLTQKSINGFNVLLYPGTFHLQGIPYEGEYYLKMQTSIGSIYYSEVFCFTNALDEYIEIEYWNKETGFKLSNGIVTFVDNFHFKILLKSELGKPEYKFEEETTNRLGYSFIESQISKKIYKFNAVLPECICDALRLVRLCSNKKLTCKDEVYDMLTFEMDVDWLEQGDLADVKCEFEIDNVIVNLGGFRHIPVGGEFNEDYSDDYNI